ncbi:unnamed protein product [Trichobilharzia regenti]|nr:unnamed protein product [Trichobilharzia regenti]
MLDPTFCIKHCSVCVVLSCDAPECYVTDCPNGCGMRMHSCKIDDHVDQICPKTIVPCINKEVGCPYFLCREDRSFHLLTCPASVVSCNARCPWLFRHAFCFYTLWSCLIVFRRTTPVMLNKKP